MSALLGLAALTVCLVVNLAGSLLGWVGAALVAVAEWGIARIEGAVGHDGR